MPPARPARRELYQLTLVRSARTTAATANVRDGATAKGLEMTTRSRFHLRGVAAALFALIVATSLMLPAVIHAQAPAPTTLVEFVHVNRVLRV